MAFTGPDTAGKSALFCKVASTLLIQMSYSVSITSAHTENVDKTL
jgi:guanylate kinase